MKITVAGMGYVGLSNAILLAQENEVKAMEIVKARVDLINQRIAPIVDAEIEDYLANHSLNLEATDDPNYAYSGAELVIIATPTNYDDANNHFDTSAVEEALDKVKEYAPQAVVVIKSTIPVGYTEEMRQKYGMDIVFSPEFLREGKALFDNLHPSRIIVGNESAQSEKVAELFAESSLDKEVPILTMPSTEAEAVKLFSNTYLALRISYFNELDTYAEVRGLNSQHIIEGVGLDPRIGDHYNNPSFGYGGYCLPKDTKQLLANYQDVPNNLIQAIVDSNATRKEHISSQVLKQDVQVVGIYRLTMKSNSDNFRQSAILDIIKHLRAERKDIIIFEPTLNEKQFDGEEVLDDFETFSQKADIILANRYAEELEAVKEKVYSRDVFNNN
ncbi:nucleotide sugar dehydrogenase [Facklamia sp. 7083-14-GEN3]|uniref:nucleotide sugar dehydrogenase n=1 Tax=Facklamia sp. 7083-14-GEN3 TaxID=2973478 RepID=UPI00215BF333|nr:nucleotide sugar dehydrogenase [Facklamia sp. 7083-14-GEN3]MCR8968917.1 nucleotide sugar dehydrogenase [Facklamia sp. 7083-14-GEN3]